MRKILELAAPLLPVLQIEDSSQAVPLAKALQAGGMQVIEVTLRTSAALESISLIRQQVPEILVGAGTVTSTQQLQQAAAAGAQFAVSPGLSPRLSSQAKEMQLPYLPGVLTPSEVLQALELGHDCCKLFPASSSDSPVLLDSLYCPFPQMVFCPTGGISQQNMNNFLCKPNVVCCGGSWLAPANLIDKQQWNEIKELSRQAKQFAQAAK